VPVLSLSANILTFSLCDSTVGMGSAEGREEGVEDLERAGNTVIELAEDIRAVDAQDAEKLRGWKLPNFPM